MKPSVRIAILALVILAVGAIVALKYRDQRQGVATTPAQPAITAAPPPEPARASMLLFADLSEANETKDACGIIIQTVRSARERGIVVTEYNSGSAPDVRKQHRVVVEPTVIVLDPSGREIARHEGEDAETVSAIRTEIERVSGGRA